MSTYSQQMRQEASAYLGQPAIVAPWDLRKAFLGRVYLAFTGGLLLAGVMCLFTLSSPALLSGVLGILTIGRGLLYIALVFGLTFGAMAVSRIPGVNVVAYALYTAFFGAITAPIVMFAAQSAGGPGVVVQALGVTGIVFGGLSVWALTTKEDLSGWGKFLFFGVLILAAVGLVGMFTGFNVGLWYSAFWVALMAGYTMYDTQMIQRRYAIDMWMPAAIALFTDFVVMFWHLLRLMSRR